MPGPPSEFFRDDEKDGEIGDLRDCRGLPGSGRSNLFDVHPSSLRLDGLDLRPGQPFAPIANALLIDAELGEGHGLPALQRLQDTRNQRPRGALSNRRPQFGDALRQVAQPDLVAIETTQGIDVDGANVDAVAIATDDPLPDLDDLIPGKWLDLVASGNHYSLLEQVHPLIARLRDRVDHVDCHAEKERREHQQNNLYVGRRIGREKAARQENDPNDQEQGRAKKRPGKTGFVNVEKVSS